MSVYAEECNHSRVEILRCLKTYFHATNHTIPADLETILDGEHTEDDSSDNNDSYRARRYARDGHDARDRHDARGVRDRRASRATFNVEEYCRSVRQLMILICYFNINSDLW